MASEISVRAATVDDVELLHRSSVDLSTYEDEPHAVTSTPQTLARDGFGMDPQFAALIAELAGKPVGFALYTFNYSVWTAARGIFIEDIWVVPEERRGGVARALMQALAQECLTRGYKRIDLNATATIPRSTKASERRIRSSCPRVTGSNDPGYTAMRGAAVMGRR